MAIETIIRKDGKKVYRAVVYRRGARGPSKSFTRRYDAQRWEEEQKELLKFGYQDKLKFIDACKAWLENHSKVKKKPASYRGDCQRVRDFEGFFKNLLLDQVSPDHIERYIALKKREGASNATVNRYLACLRKIFNDYVKKRRLLINPVSVVGTLSETKGVRDYMTMDETKKFLVGMNKKYKAKNRWVYRLYLVAINAGLRWGEIVALQWDRVNFEEKFIAVSRSYCMVSKKILESTKSDKVRYVGINSALLPELMAHFKSKTSALVFPNKAGSVLDYKNFRRDYYYKDLKEAGIRDIPFHVLRHTFASHFAIKEGSIYHLQALMGHYDVSTTQRYAHLSPRGVADKTELVSISGDEDGKI